MGTTEFILVIGSILFGLLAICIALTLHRQDKKLIAKQAREFKETSGKFEGKKGGSQNMTDPTAANALPTTRSGPKSPGDGH